MLVGIAIIVFYFVALVVPLGIDKWNKNNKKGGK